MREFFETYPYLLGSLALLILACLALWARPEHRRGMVWSGILSTPCAFLAVAFVPYYWQPRQLFWFLAGPEDFIFSFANGVMVWGMVADGSLVVRRSPRWTRTATRFGMVSMPFFLEWSVLHRAGLRLMDAACLSAITVLILLILHRPPLWRAATRGALLFVSYYVAWLAALALVAPTFLDQWNHDRLSGVRVGSIPVEEILWAILFGAVWPCLVVFLTEDRRLAGDRAP